MTHPITIITLCVLLYQPLLLAAPKAELWPVWLTSAEKVTLRPDHAYWEQFLQHRVTRSSAGINLVDYAGATSEKVGLKQYLNYLQNVPVSRLTRPQQRAFWINLYNAATVAIVLDHYPVASIRDIDISPGLFSDGPWGNKFLTIEGLQLSLDDIEHRILRPIWKDNRLHYALNCASIGCPNLQPRAFTADNSEHLLESAAMEYINHPRGVRLTDGKLQVSRIYEWFHQDFGNNERGVISHLRIYAAPELRKNLDLIEDIAGYDYDWSLNDQKKPTVPDR
ncbi:MAG: DUF547 domain-containing protein [Gammaproteobacteria bacterium]|nr:DUF547 domain-containing protein [Gammaproteobacteria bacterium]